MITIDEFVKVELKTGKVLEAEAVEGSEKLINMTVDLGEKNTRQILAGIKQWYEPESLIGKTFIFVTNLEPRKMMGLESQGMLLAAEGEKPLPLTPIEECPPGAGIH